MYKITRWYFKRPGYRRTIKTGLSLEQASEHCKEPETNSSTAASATARARTRRVGPWFDCLEECKR